MAASVYTGSFSPNEKLLAAKMNAFVLAINNHNHDQSSGTGAALTMNLTILSAAGLQVNTSTGYATINNNNLSVSTMITAGLQVSAGGYALYAA